MIKTKNLLASLSLEIPALEVSQEGQLRGGFNAFGVDSTEDVINNDNCNCNCSCGHNGNCNCNCGCTTNKNCFTCTPSATAKPTTSSQPTGVASANVLFGSSILLQATDNLSMHGDVKGERLLTIPMQLYLSSSF